MTQNIWELCGKEKHKQERRAQVTALYSDLTTADFILDIGCCEGFVTSYFLKAQLIVGLEQSKKSLLIAKQKMRQSNIEFICADATSLPIRNASFSKPFTFCTNICILHLHLHLHAKLHRVHEENHDATHNILYTTTMQHITCEQEKTSSKRTHLLS